MRFLSLASGSKGNCYYLGTPHSEVLIDCGISVRRLRETLAAHGIDYRKLDAVFLTHLHTDHMKGVGPLLRQLPLKVYAHARLVPRLRAELRLTPFTQLEGLTPFSDGGFPHRDLDVLPVAVSHDCEPTVMYKFFSGGRRLGVLTDLGVVDEPVARAFGDLDLLVLEANHDLQMLKGGPYPETLKRRIRGRRGHLSNEQAVQFITGLERLPRHLLLGHLSETNNTPGVVSGAFTRVETGVIPHHVVGQHAAGPLLELSNAR